MLEHVGKHIFCTSKYIERLANGLPYSAEKVAGAPLSSHGRLVDPWLVDLWLVDPWLGWLAPCRLTLCWSYVYHVQIML